MADDDYYKILGIDRDADEGAIKKAYRKLALKWHPDKNPDDKEAAETNFKKISEAYDVLSDGEKKQIYDKYGKAGLTGGGGGGGGGGNAHGFSFNFGGGHGGNAFHFRSADDIFRDFFEHDPFGEDILTDFFGGSFGRGGQDARSSHVSRSWDPFMHPFASFGMGGFGNGFSTFGNDPFSSGMSDGFSSSSSFSSGGGSFKSSSTSTKVVNGKRVVTKKTVENGQETVEVFENDVLTKRTVNGVPQIGGSDASSHNIHGSRR